MQILWLVGAWLIGLIAASHATQPPGAWLIVVACAVIVTVLMWKFRRWRLIALAAIALTLGATWQATHHSPLTATDLAYYNDQGTATFSGVIAAPPEVSNKVLQLRVAIDSMQDANKVNQSVSGLALVQADPLNTYRYGDRVTIHGDPLTPPTIGSFDYREYIAIDGIYTLFTRPVGITVTASDQGNPILAAVFNFRERAIGLIDTWLPSPQSALLSGIVLGVRNELPADVRDTFSATGASRVLAIDGAKVAIVIGLLSALFGRLKRKSLSAILILLCLAVYALFVGAQPPVLRAATMGALAILAGRLGRDNNGLSGLAFAIWLQTLINLAVINDAALWISATATLGLVIAAGPLQRWTERVLSRLFTQRGIHWLSAFILESILVTLVVYIAALPVMLLVFGTFSPIGILINILISPAQAPIIAFGLPAAILGTLIPPIGQLLSWIAAIPIAYTLALVRSGAQLQGSPLPVTLSAWWVAIYYGVGLALWNASQAEPGQKNSVRIWLGRLRQRLGTPGLTIGSAAIAILIWVAVLARPDGQLHLWLLDISGGGILIQTPGGAHILINGGDTPSQLNAALGDHLPFGTSTLDAVFVTTPKPNLMSALPAVLTHYQAQAIFTGAPLSGGSTVQAVDAIFSGANVPVFPITTGYTLSTGDGVTISVLSPAMIPDTGKALTTTELDKAALVLKVSYKNASFLIAPELTAPTEQALIDAHVPIQSAVLLLPSHGSDAANGPLFLKSVTPQIAALQIDSGKVAAQPAGATIARLSGTPIYRTDSQGTLSFISDGNSLWIAPERGN